MIKTSQAFLEAVTAGRRRTRIRAVVDLVGPDIVYGTATGSAQSEYSRPEQLHDKVFSLGTPYATLERNRWLLGGGFTVAPPEENVQTGFESDGLFDDNGEGELYAELRFSDVSILQACSVYFPDAVYDGYPVDFVVEVRQGGTAYYTETFTGNTEHSVSIEGFTVHIPDAIRMTVTKWSLPSRRLRVPEIVPGIYEVWTERDLSELSVVQQGKFNAMALPYGTAVMVIDNLSRRFEPRRKNGLFQSIEERQAIDLSLGVETENGNEYVRLGMFHQSGDGWKTSNNGLTMTWSLVDIIGLLANRTYLPPATLPTTLEGWIASVVAQLGVNFESRYSVDPEYAGLAVTANSVEDVTGKKCGDIIRWACMATGTWPRADAETGKLAVEPLWNQGNTIDLRNIVKYPAMKANESIAALIYHLADGDNTEFVVSGNATSSEKTVTIENPFIHSSTEALAASRLILATYGGNQIETTGRGDPSSEIGDVVTVQLDESSATTGRLMYQSFSFGNRVLQNCQSKMLQADGSYLFEAFEVISENGTWKAPAGVTQLRVVIGAGGQGGGRGQDGSVGGSGNLPGQGVSVSNGNTGVSGQGGKIWYGVININPEQEFEVTLGKGGAAGNTYGAAGALGTDTTFGPYSSANGTLYSGGYTDIANGQVFARTGVKVPLAGTSDGGAGGQGGEAGTGYWEQLFWDDGRPRGWDFIVTKQPGQGKPGVAGAGGFVMVTWDKSEETGGA